MTTDPGPESPDDPPTPDTAPTDNTYRRPTLPRSSPFRSYDDAAGALFESIHDDDEDAEDPATPPTPATEFLSPDELAKLVGEDPITPKTHRGVNPTQETASPVRGAPLAEPSEAPPAPALRPERPEPSEEPLEPPPPPGLWARIKAFFGR